MEEQEKHQVLRVRAYENGSLLRAANLAANRAARTGEGAEIYTAIVMAAASFEAFINVTIDASEPLQKGKQQRRKPDAERYYSIMSRVDRHSFKDRIDIAYLLVQGVPPDWGSLPYQDLREMYKLRNEYVHMRPRTPRPSAELKADPLRFFDGRGLLREQWGQIDLSDPEIVMTSSSLLDPVKVSRWAINTVTACVSHFAESVPESFDGHASLVSQGRTMLYAAGMASEE